MNIKVEDSSYEVLRRALMLAKLIQVKIVVSSTSPSEHVYLLIFPRGFGLEM